MKKYTLFSLLIVALLFVSSCKQSDSKVSEASPEVVKSEVATSVTQTKNSIASATNHDSGDLHWLGMGEIEAAVSNNKKKVIVDVYTDWCGPCKMMDARTFTEPAVQEAINANFHPVKFNAEGADPIEFKGKSWTNPNHDPNKRGRNSQHELASFFKVPGYPTLVVLDENFNVIKKIVGFKTAEQLIAELGTI